jgi:N-methylhydantoinase A
MLASRPGRQLSRTWLGLLDERSDVQIEAQLSALARQGVESLVREGADRDGLGIRFSLDLRYRGQSHTLNVPWTRGREEARAAFGHRHEHRYGHRLDLPVELVNLRAAVFAPAPQPVFDPPHGEDGGSSPAHRVRVHGIDGPVPVFRRAGLALGTEIRGPAIIAETVATTWLAPGWRCEVDPMGNLLLDGSG